MSYPPFQKPDKDGYVKHIHKEGARYHVISWDSFGQRCSEPKCEINKHRKKVNNDTR